jgi:hypothetical protein
MGKKRGPFSSKLVLIRVFYTKFSLIWVAGAFIDIPSWAYLDKTNEI